MVTFKSWASEQKVRGFYYGVSFTGSLATSGQNMDGTVNVTKCRNGPGTSFIFVVRLDAPLTVYGRIRRYVEIWDNDDNELHLM